MRRTRLSAALSSPTLKQSSPSASKNCDEIVNHDNAGRGLLLKRDTDDEAALAKRELIVNGVISDPNFGPDSALYEALGFVRKSDRKSGLTRKKTEAPK